MIYFGKNFSPVDECVFENSHEVLREMNQDYKSGTSGRETPHIAHSSTGNCVR